MCRKIMKCRYSGSSETFKSEGFRSWNQLLDNNYLKTVRIRPQLKLNSTATSTARVTVVVKLKENEKAKRRYDASQKIMPFRCICPSTIHEAAINHEADLFAQTSLISTGNQHQIYINKSPCSITIKTLRISKERNARYRQIPENLE
ncbi:hypothetical protein DINM_007319 [Dirofilaria immitis]|nr:hypothetical protein [Dirofilaria immitis]